MPIIQLGAPSRFAGLTPLAARLALALLAALMMIGLASTWRTTTASTAETVHIAPVDEAAEHDDLRLYQAIIAGVAEGRDYHAVAAEEQRARGFPLKPFVTMRLPTLATLSALLGPAATRGALLALALAVLLVWWGGIAAENPRRRVIAMGLLVAGVATGLRPELVWLHETWAGLLIALAIGLYHPDRCWSAVLAGLAAVLIRETALPFLCLMVGLAAFGRRWREAASWGAAIALAAVFIAWHASQWAAVVRPGDIASQGWSSVAGWPQVLAYMDKVSALRLLPGWAAALIVPLALFGWAAARSLAAGAVFLLLCGYCALFALAGRPENFYWALLVTPLLPLGLAAAPRGIADLLQAGLSPRLHSA